MIDTIPEMAAALAEKGAEVFLSRADGIDRGAVTAFLATRPLQP